jgi:hypothetical protein
MSLWKGGESVAINGKTKCNAIDEEYDAILQPIE